MRNGFVAIAALALAGCTTTQATGSSAAATGAPVEVHLLAINDFHGNLEPPSGGARVFNPANPGRWDTTPGGGAPRLATAVAELGKRPNTLMVAAGDLIGASPLLSSLFHDEPTIESLSRWASPSPLSAITSSTKAGRSCAACRMAAAIRSTAARDRSPSKARSSSISPPPPILDNGQTLFPPYAIRDIRRREGRLHRP